MINILKLGCAKHHNALLCLRLLIMETTFTAKIAKASSFK